VLAPGEYELNPFRPDEIERLFQETLSGAEPDRRGVVSLWTLESPWLGENGAGSPSAAMGRLVDALSESASRASARLWFVIRGAQAVKIGLATRKRTPIGRRLTQRKADEGSRCTWVDLGPKAAWDDVYAIIRALWVGKEDSETAP
jgi:hypothetical protein